jgi:ribosome-associated protein
LDAASDDSRAMSNASSSAPQPVTVRAVPIELCQFLKFAGLAESGGAAKEAIAQERVAVNGTIETQKRKKLTVGDQVTFEGRTIVVHLG